MQGKKELLERCCDRLTLDKQKHFVEFWCDQRFVVIFKSKKKKKIIFEGILVKRVISVKHVSTLSGVYSVIARLEPMGEARSTAELYLSGKGL